jgi:OmcA/MtrC family decaheme c-type cytochrome
VNYASSANVADCVKCHTDPYLKHGYIYGEVNHDAATDFVTCKACHLDNNPGEHLEWQLLQDNPPLWAQFMEDDTVLTEEQRTYYAYNPSLMNDVHMSHAMEFPMPSSMANCVTCHEGKLDAILADTNFNIKLCRSCHVPTGMAAPAAEGESPAWDTTGLALATIVPKEIHGSMDLNTTDCTMCHGEGKSASSFRKIHSGYDKTVYTADGIRYSDVISTTIDATSFADNLLTVQLSAHGTLDGVDVATITPTLLVGLYGWDTKDFIIGPHERLIDDNADGTIDSKDARTLEADLGTEHPRIKTVSAEGGKWEATVDLSPWAEMLADGTVRRVEIGVIPDLNVEGMTLALDAPSRTFDLGANDFADDYYSPIVTVEKCETCHVALATNFHSPSYGGNIVVCRLCHISKAGGSHLEMESRAIDSYAHAIHSMQYFDIGDVDFTDPVQALHYDDHIEFPYPTHGITNCASCHEANTNNVPDQTKSLPALLSASDELQGRDRKIGAIPSYVTGPASRACGGCHRAVMINEDDAVRLGAFNRHVTTGGYLVPAGEVPLETWGTVTTEIMSVYGK